MYVKSMYETKVMEMVYERDYLGQRSWELTKRIRKYECDIRILFKLCIYGNPFHD